jgi:hypothetical protein
MAISVKVIISCKRMVNSCKCYTLIEGWKSIHWPYISAMGNVLTSC